MTVSQTHNKRTNPAKSDRKTSLQKRDEVDPAIIHTSPLGPYTIENRILIALQPLDLLSWALVARLDDSNEIEVFTEPLLETERQLRALCEEIHAHGLDAKVVP